MQIKRILEELMAEESGAIPANTITSFRKWCDANNCYVDQKSSIDKFVNDIKEYLLDTINAK